MTDSVVDTRIFVARQNLRRYEEILENLVEPKARETVEQLIAEAKAELEASEAQKESMLVAAAGDRSLRARRWRLKAGEYRATADITQSDAARATYVRLAQDYERLADAEEARIGGERQARPKME